MARDSTARARELQILAELKGVKGRRRELLILELVRVGEWMPQARALASRYRSQTCGADDLIQAALHGLLECVDRYDPAKLNDGRGWVSWVYQRMWWRVSECARLQGAIVIEADSERRAVRRGLRQRRPGGYASLPPER